MICSPLTTKSHTPDGGVITLEAPQNGTRALITVTDTGPGISPEHLSHIFERFYQVDAARQEKSAGLGLPIAKALVEAHGGEINIKSQPGRGVTVHFSIPLAR